MADMNVLVASNESDELILGFVSKFWDMIREMLGGLTDDFPVPVGPITLTKKKVQYETR